MEKTDARDVSNRVLKRIRAEARTRARKRGRARLAQFRGAGTSVADYHEEDE